MRGKPVQIIEWIKNNYKTKGTDALELYTLELEIEVDDSESLEDIIEGLDLIISKKILEKSYRIIYYLRGRAEALSDGIPAQSSMVDYFVLNLGYEKIIRDIEDGNYKDIFKYSPNISIKTDRDRGIHTLKLRLKYDFGI